jgi:hypothetical protein
MQACISECVGPDGSITFSDHSCGKHRSAKVYESRDLGERTGYTGPRDGERAYAEQWSREGDSIRSTTKISHRDKMRLREIERRKREIRDRAADVNWKAGITLEEELRTLDREADAIPIARRKR